MIVFSTEEYKDVINEMFPLIESHWQEVSLHKDKVPLSLDHQRYNEMQERGKLHIVTARDEGKLVGYFASFVDYHLHYKETMMAVNDALFLDKDYRKGSLAKDMFTFAEKELKELGVKVIHLHMKVEHPFDKLCESCGYTNSERLYAKYIGE